MTSIHVRLVNCMRIQGINRGTLRYNAPLTIHRVANRRFFHHSLIIGATPKVQMSHLPDMPTHVEAEPKPKVLHIISGDLWAGAEVQGYTLLKSLHQQVDLSVILLNEGTLADKLRVTGIDVLIIDEAVLGAVGIVKELCKAMKTWKPGVVHTHRQKENILGSVANFLTVRAKSLRTVHGAAEFTPKGLQRIQRIADRFCGNYLQHAVISVSQDLSTTLRKIYKPETVYVIPNGIALPETADLKQRIPSENTPFEKKPLTLDIGLIGRLEPVKRVDIFLKMAKILLSEESKYSWRFHILGDGKLRKDMEALTVTLGISESVQFYGHQSDVFPYLLKLDYLVMCSDHEGLPMGVLEALAMNVKTVPHAVGGLTELFSPFPEWLCTDHSAEGYAAKLLAAEQNAYPAPYLPSQYTAEANAQKTLELYRHLRSA